MTKSTCSLGCYIFSPPLGQFMNTTPVKSFLLPRIFYRGTSLYIRMNYSAAQKTRNPFMHRRGNRKEPSRASNAHGV